MTAPTVLLLYQQVWVGDDAPVKLCEKSRRVGISWAEAADDALAGAAEKSAGGDDTWYIGYNQDMAREFIRDVAFWARHYQLAAGEMEEEVIKDEDRDILAFVIRFSSGHRVSALSSRPSNLRGKQGRVVIDEAAFHEDLPGLIKAAMALLMWGGKVRIISSHNGDSNPFAELVNDCRAGKFPYSVHRIEFQAAVAQGLFQRICLSTGREWTPEAEAAWVAEMYAYYGDHAAEELDVIPSSGSGSYLTRAQIEACMVPSPVLRLELSDGFSLLPSDTRVAEVAEWCAEHLAPLLGNLVREERHYLGQDFARSRHLSVMWPLAQKQTLDLHTPFIVELRNVPFEQQRQILFYLLDGLPRFGSAAMDARGNGQYLAEVATQKYGTHRILSVMLSIAWYRENMPRFKAAFEDRTLTVPKDADVLSDLRQIRMENGVAKVPESDTRGSDGAPRHGDTAMALALGIHATQMDEPLPCTGFQSVERRGAGGISRRMY